jgi:hypothetical protein
VLRWKFEVQMKLLDNEVVKGSLKKSEWWESTRRTGDMA